MISPTTTMYMGRFKCSDASRIPRLSSLSSFQRAPVHDRHDDRRTLARAVASGGSIEMTMFPLPSRS